MEIGWDILWFIIGVSLLVTVHEFGHFWVARRLGFKVLRFSVGFGKPLFKKVGGAPDHTEYVIAAVPLGGYVRMLDERDGAVAPADLPRAFASRPPWQRILVLLAGPAANILFAILVLWGMFMADSVTEIKPVIGEVTTGSIAASAGLRAGDETSLHQRHADPRPDRCIHRVVRRASATRASCTSRYAARMAANATVDMVVADPAERHKLTEPLKLNRGLGFEFWRVTLPALLVEVEAGGPADQAGLKSGDLVVAIRRAAGAQPGSSSPSYVHARPAQEILVTVRRDGQELSRRVLTVSAVIQGETIGRIMVEIPQDRENSFPPT